MSARRTFKDSITVVANSFGALLVKEKQSCALTLASQDLLHEFTIILAGYLDVEACDYLFLAADKDTVHRYSEYQCLPYERVDVEAAKQHVFVCIDYDSAPHNIKRRLKHKTHIRLSVL